MPIWTFINPFLLVANHSANAAAVPPVPTYDLAMAAIAIAAWALAVAVIAAWLRARESSAARAHIRSIRIARRDGGGAVNNGKRGAQDKRKPRHWGVRPLEQI